MVGANSDAVKQGLVTVVSRASRKSDLHIMQGQDPWRCLSQAASCVIAKAG